MKRVIHTVDEDGCPVTIIEERPDPEPGKVYVNDDWEEEDIVTERKDL